MRSSLFRCNAAPCRCPSEPRHSLHDSEDPFIFDFFMGSPSAEIDASTSSMDQLQNVGFHSLQSQPVSDAQELPSLNQASDLFSMISPQNLICAPEACEYLLCRLANCYKVIFQQMLKSYGILGMGIR